MGLAAISRARRDSTEGSMRLSIIKTDKKEPRFYARGCIPHKIVVRHLVGFPEGKKLKMPIDASAAK
jgi:hypothetical protein